jgi:hypothetical protein
MLKRERRAHILTVRGDLQEGKVINFNGVALRLSYDQFFYSHESVSSPQQKATFEKKTISPITGGISKRGCDRSVLEFGRALPLQIEIL